ncbi:pentatricopeptide repeat-containing protein [Tanacetum coccineum]|uniref:Pentatricopeptide repeat-containing protein n=1 Tax=Tanacetum coccineum TaxID=301880 RepID=A0ABQ5D0D2_9ASTR
MDEAVVLFEACATRDTVLLNIMVSAISHNLQGEDALKLFMKMCNENAGLSEHALISIVDAYGSPTREISACFGDENGALIHMYSKCGNIDEALRLFRLGGVGVTPHQVRSPSPSELKTPLPPHM